MTTCGRFLSQNRVAEFHTELERLPAKEVQNNVYIKHPVSLEQYIMEGSYNKVLMSKHAFICHNSIFTHAFRKLLIFP